jgi:hypothetical protein
MALPLDPSSFLRTEITPFAGLHLHDLGEGVSTPMGAVRLMACWWGERPYVCAAFTLDIPTPPYKSFWPGDQRGWTSYVCAPLEPDGRDDRARLWVPDRSRPYTGFREADPTHPYWAPYQQAIGAHIVPLLGPWGHAHRHLFAAVRRALAQERVDRLTRQLKALATPLANAQARVESRVGALHDIEERLTALGVSLPPDPIPDGWQVARKRTSRGRIALQVRVYRRLAVVVAADDASVQRSLATLMEQWWAYWQSPKRLARELGWFWIGDRLITRGRPDGARLTVGSQPFPYPSELSTDPEADAWFRANEWRLLFGALEVVRPRAKAATDERDALQRDRQALDAERNAVAVELGLAVNVVHPQDVPPATAMP